MPAAMPAAMPSAAIPPVAAAVVHGTPEELFELYDEEDAHGIPKVMEQIGTNGINKQRPRTSVLTTSRRRDCHSAAPQSAFIRCFNTDKKGGVIKMTVSPMASPRH